MTRGQLRNMNFFRVGLCAFRTLPFLAATLWATVSGAFEQDQRINGLTMQFGIDSFATANALGGAFASSVQSQVQSGINSRITSGQISLLFEMPGLVDLTGTNEPSLQIGLVNGAPVHNTNNPTPYSGTSDLDWWYTANPSELNQNGQPSVQLAGSITARAFAAGGAEIAFPYPFGSAGQIAMSSVAIKATVGSSSAPLESTNNFPPGHLPSENLSPSLVSFASMTAGQLKGNISAASLAAIPQTLGATTDQGYTSSNSILDVLVSGATYLTIRLVNPTQPDQTDTNAPVAGAGPPYRFTVGPAHMVTGCVDKNNTPVNLAAGLKAAAYSAYFTFTTDRIIAHILEPPTLSIARSGTNIVLTVTALTNSTVYIEYKQSLADTGWTALQNFLGTGAPATITDINATNRTRFYRAKVR